MRTYFRLAAPCWSSYAIQTLMQLRAASLLAWRPWVLDCCLWSYSCVQWLVRFVPSPPLCLPGWLLSRPLPRPLPWSSSYLFLMHPLQCPSSGAPPLQTRHALPESLSSSARRRNATGVQAQCRGWLREPRAGLAPSLACSSWLVSCFWIPASQVFSGQAAKVGCTRHQPDTAAIRCNIPSFLPSFLQSSASAAVQAN